MTNTFFETDQCGRFIELVAHITGIPVEDLDAVLLSADVVGAP